MNNQRGFPRKRVENRAEYYLPDEIVTDILTRLPAKDVLNCRCVCRRFKDLTSDQSFNYLHLIKHRLPMILVVDDRITRHVDTFLLDKWWETGRTRSLIHRFSSRYRQLLSDIGVVASQHNNFDSKFYILFSLNGLIASGQFISETESLRKFVIFNPMNGENVIISLSREIYMSDLHGVYFHPLLKEYCTLWRISPKSWYDLENTEYKVLNLGSNHSCWHTISNPSNKNPRFHFIDPVFIDKYLYWAVEARQDDIYYNCPVSTTAPLHLDIMEFDVISEELKLMPCPVPVVFKNLHSDLICNINLLNFEGCLSLVQISRGKKLVVDINIWTLKDRVQQLWECSNYRINLDLHPRKFHFKVGVLKAICAANGELAIQSHRTLYVYNLKRGTIRIMGKKKHTHDVLFLSHLMSFASLKNCKSNICMDECGEVDKKEKKSLVLLKSSGDLQLK